MITLTLTPEQEGLLIREGERHTSLAQGPAAAEFWVNSLITKEIARITHWERTFLPVPKTSKSPGRPVEDAQYHRIKQIAEHLGGVYVRLRNLYPTTFEENHGFAEREWQRRVREKDLLWLEQFENDQPWVKKFPTIERAG